MGSDLYYGKTTALLYEVGCKATTHEYFFAKFFSQINLGITGKTKILDVGCGGGRLAMTLLKEYARKRKISPQVHAFDISPEMLEHAEKSATRAKLMQNLTLYQGDAQDFTKLRKFEKEKISQDIITLEDKSFDIVMSSGLLECVPDPELTIKEMMRVLKPGGHIIISFINDNFVGHCAGVLYQFKPLDQNYILSRFNQIKEFTQFKVKTFNPYMKSLRSIYVGQKNPQL